MWGQPPPAVPGAQLRKVLTFSYGISEVVSPPGFARPDSGEPALSLPKGRLSPHEVVHESPPIFFASPRPRLVLTTDQPAPLDLQDWFPVPHTGTGARAAR